MLLLSWGGTVQALLPASAAPEGRKGSRSAPNVRYCSLRDFYGIVNYFAGNLFRGKEARISLRLPVALVPGFL
jgi:hypothetical protein